jgi:signal transduction histidine kinase
MPAASTPPPAAGKRSPVLLGLILGFVLLHLAAVGNSVWAMSQRTGGFLFYTPYVGSLVAFPLTVEAWEAVEPLGDPKLLQAVNGRRVERNTVDPGTVHALVDTTPGAKNRFELVDRAGKTAEFELTAGTPSYSALLRHVPGLPMGEFVSLLYFALGVFVWWKRPQDRAAVPMLLFSLLAAVQLTPVLAHGAAGRMLLGLAGMLFPLYGPGLLNLGLKFTGCHERTWFKRLFWFSTIYAVACGATLGIVLAGAPQRELILDVLVRATGVLLLLNVVATVFVSLLCARAPHPLGLRRRARVLAVACLVSFGFPSASLLLPDLDSTAFLMIQLCLGAFPIIIAYAVVRHGMFDVRVVLGQGLIYVTLSLGVLLAYLGLVFATVELIGSVPHSPLVTALFVVVLVITLSLVQLRVQRALSRRLFRSRYVYAEAVERASDKLATARTAEAILATMRDALMGAMQLSRAYFAHLDPGAQRLHCIALGSEPDRTTGERPAPLPDVLDPRSVRPIARALRSKRTVTASDSTAASAQVANSPDGPPSCVAPNEEAAFWNHHGIEAILPLLAGREGDAFRVMGLILLGPKQSERPFDRGDQSLLQTLANQLAIAWENAAAFEEIQQLKSGLEDQVKERTRDLSEALNELQQAQAQLVEQEKQAVLGRLVAGIVHEVNNPVAVLHSSADTLARLLGRLRTFVEQHANSGDPAAQSLLEATARADQLGGAMQTSGDRLGELVLSLKRFVALDEAEVRVFDVREGIDSAVTLLSPTLGTGVRIARRYESETTLVDCSPAKLNQVFVNLLSNAAEALEGEGEIRITVARTNGLVLIEFSDDGPGIPEDRVDRLFELGLTQKRGRVGLRLGLPTSKRLVQELGGSISIETVYGQGTSVRLRLPASSD